MRFTILEEIKSTLPQSLFYNQVNSEANFVTTSYQKISGFDRPHVSEMLSDSKISTLECGFKNFRICLRIRRMRVDDSRIRKEKVSDSKISGYVVESPAFGAE